MLKEGNFVIRHILERKLEENLTPFYEDMIGHYKRNNEVCSYFFCLFD